MPSHRIFTTHLVLEKSITTTRAITCIAPILAHSGIYFEAPDITECQGYLSDGYDCEKVCKHVAQKLTISHITSIKINRTFLSATGLGMSNTGGLPLFHPALQQRCL